MSFVSAARCWPLSIPAEGRCAALCRVPGKGSCGLVPCSEQLCTPARCRPRALSHQLLTCALMKLCLLHSSVSEERISPHLLHLTFEFVTF